MSDVNNGSGWVYTELDDEFIATLKALGEIGFIDHSRGSLVEEIVYGGIHRNLIFRYYLLYDISPKLE
jgi:hypothetical protein